MLIKIGYDISLRFPVPTALVHLLHVHPSRRSDLIEPERFLTEPAVPMEQFYDGFGNHVGRVSAPAGTLRLLSEGVIRDSGAPDAYAPNAAQLDVSEIPTRALPFLLPSRYCEVDSQLMDFAWNTFAKTTPGWDRVQAICDFVHGHLQFDYLKARADRTALEAFRERAYHNVIWEPISGSLPCHHRRDRFSTDLSPFFKAPQYEEIAGSRGSQKLQ
jgi:transglutaminase-like putative cysteine protease